MRKKIFVVLFLLIVISVSFYLYIEANTYDLAPLDYIDDIKSKPTI